MSDYSVTRAHLRNACQEKNWDLLDKLLELDSSGIDDKSVFTDTWGSWWGMLLECCMNEEPDGVRVLLKHGADRTVRMWGDGFITSPEEAAEENRNSEILELLRQEKVTYTRKTDPELPDSLSEGDRKFNRAGEIRDATGLVFPTDE